MRAASTRTRCSAPTCELNLSRDDVRLSAGRRQRTRRRCAIFTPRKELPFAGHPTIGTAFVIRGASETNELVLEEGVGPVPVRVAKGTSGALQFWLTTPPIVFGERVDPARVAGALGLHPNDLLVDVQPEVAGAGPMFLFVALKNKELVDRIDVLDSRALLMPDPPAGVFVFARLEESDAQDAATRTPSTRCTCSHPKPASPKIRPPAAPRGRSSRS